MDLSKTFSYSLTKNVYFVDYSCHSQSYEVGISCKLKVRRRRKCDVANLLVRRTEKRRRVVIFLNVVSRSSSSLGGSVSSKQKR